MNYITCTDYDTMSKLAAEFVANEVKSRPTFVLGLPTGSTPIGMYKRLSCMANEGNLDFSGVTFFNLDEYYPIAGTHPESYKYFMQKHLFGNINVNPARIHIPSGEAADPQAECAAYDAEIAAAGGIDLMVLGIGVNGHIGFNEPDVTLRAETHLTTLTQSTIEANARNFPSPDDVPRTALTMGMGSICQAKKILLLASGENKRGAVDAMRSGAISTQSPASLLMLHRDVTVMVC